MRIGRRRIRSIHAPAGRVKSRNGRNSTVASAPTWAAEAFRNTIAV